MLLEDLVKVQSKHTTSESYAKKIEVNRLKHRCPYWDMTSARWVESNSCSQQTAFQNFAWYIVKCAWQFVHSHTIKFVGRAPSCVSRSLLEQSPNTFKNDGNSRELPDVLVHSDARMLNTLDLGGWSLEPQPSS